MATIRKSYHDMIEVKGKQIPDPLRELIEYERKIRHVKTLFQIFYVTTNFNTKIIDNILALWSNESVNNSQLDHQLLIDMIYHQDANFAKYINQLITYNLISGLVIPDEIKEPDY